MKKVFLSILLISTLLVLIGCVQKDANENINVEFADTMTEEVLLAMNHEDYQEFSKNFSDTMKEQINEEMFHSQISMIRDIIGDYEGNSKELLETEIVDKNFTRVYYNAKYTKEEGNVIITMVFNNGENPQVEGLFFNSPKLQKMQ